MRNVGGYRLYLFDGPAHPGGRITRSVPIYSADEDEAVQIAERVRAGAYAELWRLENVVRIFQPDQSLA